MRVFQFISLLFLIANGNEIKYQYNYTNLIYQYFLVCGPEHLCRVSDFNFPYLPDYKYDPVCPTCYCDDRCVPRGDCCPDLYFSLPFQSCVNVTIIQATQNAEREQRSQYLMISTCPDNSDSEMVRKCDGHSLLERFQNLPVTGNTRYLTYYNKYCAECNDESNFTHWSLDFYCEKFSDFNFLSTFDELVMQAIDRHCVIQSFPELIESRVRNCSEDSEGRELYNACNMTNLWLNYDFDVIYGCELASFHGHFRFFKNVFCYICNPSYVTNDITEDCNKTGVWEPLDQGLSNACTGYQATTATYPYKNIFCYLCNKNNYEPDQFVDVKGFIKEELTQTFNISTGKSSTVVRYQVHIHSFKQQYLRVITTRMVNTSPELRNVESQSPQGDIFMTTDGRSINFTNLMLKYMSLGGSKICQKSLVPSFVRNLTQPCDCRPSCLFSRYQIDCCIDTVLRYPGKCINEILYGYNKISEVTEFYVTNGCSVKDNVSKLFRTGCLGKGSDIFSSLPLTDLQSGISYSNLFCLLCNNEISLKIRSKFVNEAANNKDGGLEINRTQEEYFSIQLDFDGSSYDPWDLSVVCDMYVDFPHYLLLSDMINTLKAMSCFVMYRPLPYDDDQNYTSTYSHRSARYCPRDNFYKKCNLTGKWTNADDDISWACADVSKGSALKWRGYFEDEYFKNEFCAICNPSNFSEQIISSCNVTGQMEVYDPMEERLCSYFPQIDYFSPYKNFFCASCNIVLSKYIYGSNGKKGLSGDLSSEKVWLPIYRNIFSLSTYEDLMMSRRAEERCAINQVFDSLTNTCRNITCYPGKYRYNATCVPLLPRTSYLRYTLSVGFKGQVNQKIRTLLLMDDVMYLVSSDFMQKLNLYYNPVTDFNIMVNRQCLHESQLIDSTDFQGLIYFSVFIREAVPRAETEENLLKFYSSDIAGNFSDRLYNIIIHRDTEAKYLSLRKGRYGFKKQCYKYIAIGPSLSSIPYQQYRLVSVSQTMICDQIELEIDEFEIDYRLLLLILRKQRITFEYGDFDVLPNGQARICVETYKNRLYNAKVKLEDTSGDVLFVISTVCTAMSLFCLLITFATYCIFRVLRSTPGKTNMNLVIVLFITTLLYQVGMGKTEHPELCKGLGILLHYFWLASFAAMQVCCFHMYCSFRSNIVTNSKKSKKIRFYCLYTYIVPAVIVVVNIIAMISHSSGKDIGYGGGKCFISGRTSFIISFLTPVIVICLLNVFCFVSTTRAIKQTPQVRSNRTDRDNFRIFARLFTVTGISWILQIVDGFLPINAFSFVITIINALQGVFIFIAFVCNKRIVHLYKTALKSKTTRHEFETPGSTDTYASKSLTETSRIASL